MLPYRIPGGEVPHSEGFIHDRYSGGGDRIVLSELSSRDERSLQSLEKARPSSNEIRVIILRDRLSFGNSRFTPGRSTERSVSRHAHRENAGDSLEFIEQLFRKSCPMLQIHQQYTFSFETRIQIFKIFQSPYEKA